MATRRLLLGAALATPAFGTAFAQAPAWPQRPVRFIAAAAPGGIIDVVARLLGEQLRDIWGQNIVVENRGGAGGALAAQAVARAAPDGYTALVTTASFAINLSLSRNPGYSAQEFVPAIAVAGTPHLFVVRADSPIRTLRDLVEAARRRPVNFGSAGVGTPGHLSGALLFQRDGGTQAAHVPYAGGAPAMAAVLSGDIDMASIPLPTGVPHIQGGRARGLAVTTAERRSEALPDVPMVAEAGFAPIVDINWVTMFFPAGTPQPVLERVNADVRRVMERPAFQQRLAAAGLDPIGGDLAATTTFIAAEIVRLREVVRVVGVQID